MIFSYLATEDTSDPSSAPSRRQLAATRDLTNVLQTCKAFNNAAGYVWDKYIHANFPLIRLALLSALRYNSPTKLQIFSDALTTPAARFHEYLLMGKPTNIHRLLKELRDAASQTHYLDPQIFHTIAQAKASKIRTITFEMFQSQASNPSTTKPEIIALLDILTRRFGINTKIVLYKIAKATPASYIGSQRFFDLFRTHQIDIKPFLIPAVENLDPSIIRYIIHILGPDLITPSLVHSIFTIPTASDASRTATLLALLDTHSISMMIEIIAYLFLRGSLPVLRNILTHWDLHTDASAKSSLSSNPLRLWTLILALQDLPYCAPNRNNNAAAKVRILRDSIPIPPTLALSTLPAVWTAQPSFRPAIVELLKAGLVLIRELLTAALTPSPNTTTSNDTLALVRKWTGPVDVAILYEAAAFDGHIAASALLDPNHRNFPRNPSAPVLHELLK